MINLFDNAVDLQRALATQIVNIAAAAVAERGRFIVAFSGGSLPALVCPPLIQDFASQIDWSAWHLFLVDERCVPLDHSESNYRLLREALLDHASIPPHQVYPVAVALDPAAAALDYTAQLTTVFGAEHLPRFDLLLLGMGPDGHTASLFPDHALLTEKAQWVAPIWNAPKPPPQRVTLTLPVLNAARQVCFVVTGASKAAMVAAVLTAPPTPACPASLVRPHDGELAWFLDAAAAAQWQP